MCTHFLTGKNEDQNPCLAGLTGQEHMHKVPGTNRVLSKWQWWRGQKWEKQGESCH